MTRRPWACSCGVYGPLKCDWPTATGGTCGKSICESCARKDGDRDYCPFHRGAPPVPEDVKAEQDRAAGEAAADEAARILGVKRAPRGVGATGH